MKHEEAEKKIDPYLLGWLSVNESEAFEAHYMECDNCFKELSLAREYTENLREVLEQRQSEPGFLLSKKSTTAVGITGLLQVAASFFLKPAVAYLIVLALLYPAYRGIFQRPKVVVQEVTKEGTEERRKLNDEAKALRERNAAYESQIADLNKKLQQVSAEHQRQIDELKEGNRRLADYIKPVANPPALSLAFLNTRSSEQAQGVVFKDELWLDIDTRFDEENKFSSYSLRIVDEQGRILWQQEHVKKDKLGGVTLRIPRAFLKAGAYRVRVYGVDGNKKSLIKQDRFRLMM